MRLGLVTEAFAGRSPADLLDWLEHEAPEITDPEIGLKDKDSCGSGCDPPWPGRQRRPRPRGDPA